MKRDTLYVSINYVDRYLSLRHNVAKQRLQLIGVVALFIASKMEEILPPGIDDFARSTSYTYSVKEIVETE